MNKKKESKVVPNVRFKGFTDDWKQRKLGDVSEIIGGGTPSTNHPEYWDGDIDWYSPAEILDQIYVKRSRRRITQLGYDNSSAKLLPPGTVLFTSRAGIGKTAILSQKSCTNQGFQSIVPHENELDTYFIFSRTNALKRYGELVGAGSTFAEVSGKQMSAMNLMLPTTIQEQQVIGQFFKKLDRLITLHQQKITLLTNLKKTMLEKMFPKKGSVIPEIRFNGVANAWEQRKLGDILEERTEKASGDEELLSVTIGNGVIRQVDSDKRNIASEDKSNYKIVKKGDIPYNSMRMWQGAVGNSEYDGIVSPAYTVLTPTVDANGKFFMELFKKESTLQIFQRWSQGLTSDTWNLKYPILSTIKFNIPPVEEQTRIAEYFSNLDHLITLHQRKLDMLKKLKSACLSEMFI